MPKVHEFKFVKKGMVLVILSLFLLYSVIAQQNIRTGIQNREELKRFSQQKSTEWNITKRKADSLANILQMPNYYIESDGNKVVILQGLGPKNKPVYYATDNLNAAAIISVDDVWISNNEYPTLTGSGIDINLWDGGSVRTTHQELQNGPGTRIVSRDLELPLSNHSTHIAGTMIATGVNPEARGMAGKATIKAWDLKNDIAEMSGEAADGILISNHSYGPFCGWTYNSSNESWYWYGDPEISATEDYEFGFYNQTSADLDYIAHLAPDYLIVKSAGNDRNDGPTDSFVHFVWDGVWKQVNVEREPDGGVDGYDCLTPMAVSKNILTVGAVDDAKAMTVFSAYGPTDDGRIKPDVVANGADVISSISTADNTYASYSGTSMSTASATGSVALLHQLQNTLQPGVQLHSSTIKGILIHTATDLGNTGPDYRFGWGLLDIKKAADIIYDNSINQGKYIVEEVLSQGEEIIIPVSTSDLFPFLKVTLSWTDPAGQPSSPSLNPRTKKLVNDLDVSVKNTGNLTTYLPWALNVENPGANATKNINHTDNVEQVYIANPGNNNFNIKISHSGTLSGGSQAFSLIITGIETKTNIFPPKNLTYTINDSGVGLMWDPPVSGTPASYKIYRNGNLLKETTGMFYIDQTVVLNIVYEYFVTAVYYVNNEKTESVGTNTIKVYPQPLRTLPFIVDFEKEPTEVTIKNNEFGWRWGNSETLNCYYLNFSANTTKFIGIDSYSAGDAVHVSDIAYTVPLRLADYTNVSLSFDFLMVTDFYDVINELHVVYKLQEEKEWQELLELRSSYGWKQKTIALPPEMCKNGTQIGFYYDDFYQVGIGAGLDNIKITGEPIQPVQICTDLKFIPGWNIFSINNTPSSVNMFTYFQTLIDNYSLVKIMDEFGNTLEDYGVNGDWINSIGDISPTEGYKIYLNKDVSLKVCGTPVNYPFAIPLKSGWNIAGYPQQSSYNAKNVVQQLIDRGSLEKVIDEEGNTIEDYGVFGGWQNYIGDFMVGEGYKINVNKDDILYIYESYPKTTTILPQFVSTSHFKTAFVGNGVDHMNIYLVNLPVNVLQVGDELAVFDERTCVGAATLTPYHLDSQTISIAASASDNLGTPGFLEGNPFTLKLWKSQQNMELALKPEIVKGPSTFTKLSTTIASFENIVNTGINKIPGSNVAEINCFPNPFREEVVIEINLRIESEVKVEVLNQLGQQVKFISPGQLLPAGLHKLNWDGTNTVYQAVSPGIYFLRIGVNDFIIHRKILLIK